MGINAEARAEIRGSALLFRLRLFGREVTAAVAHQHLFAGRHFDLDAAEAAVRVLVSGGVGEDVLLPQVFLSGLLIPVEQLPEYLRPIAAALPLTYANEALRSVMIKGYELADPLVLRDIAVLAAFGLLMAIGAVASIRREVA